jgi:8-oxo-dGTP diphosphatase
MSDKIIGVVAALIRDDAGRMLVVRKRGTEAFMQPGGKRDAGEDDLTALEREISEELGCRMVPGSAQALGQFNSVAANEPGWQVLWIDPTAPEAIVLAPLTRDHVLPLAAHGFSL